MRQEKASLALLDRRRIFYSGSCASKSRRKSFVRTWAAHFQGNVEMRQELAPLKYP